jgi:hypothetical protein
MDRAMGRTGGGGGAGLRSGGGRDGRDGDGTGGADGGNALAPPAPAAASVSGSGPLLALDLSFDLPPSCYATMLVRELTKACTGKGAHAELSRQAAAERAAAVAGAGHAAEAAGAP